MPLLLCGCTTSVKHDDINVLVFTRTQGFRHTSIPAGVEAIRTLCEEAGFRMLHTEDAEVFTDETLARFDVVTFLNTTGDVLDPDQQRAVETWFTSSGAGGRGFVGIHAAADTEYDWPFYRDLVGTHFASHPPVQQAIVMRKDPAHPSTSMLPDRWARTDEWYNYRPRTLDRTFIVLLALDTDSYQGSTMPEGHPIAWCREFKSFRGRMFYTGGGHTIESFAEPLFLEHLAGGLQWAAHRRD